MRAYDELYLEKARIALGRMFDFAVYQLGYNIEKFYDLFISSGMAKRFENGDVSILVGRSGVEIAYEVLYYTYGYVEPIEVKFTVRRSEEYWAGWVLALYSLCHEMDIRQVIDRLDEMMGDDSKNVKLIKVCKTCVK